MVKDNFWSVNDYLKKNLYKKTRKKKCVKKIMCMKIFAQRPENYDCGRQKKKSLPPE